MLTLTGFDLLPSDDQAAAVCADLFSGDPVAERFVDEVYHGETGPTKTRRLLNRALTDGIDSLENAPASMRELFAEFETVPDWVDPDSSSRARPSGAAGAPCSSASRAPRPFRSTPNRPWRPRSSLAGGYAGHNARVGSWRPAGSGWMSPSPARCCARLAGTRHRDEGARHARSVRLRVASHDEWDIEKWGLPISQTYMMLTLIAGSVTPGLALWTLGYQTSPREIRALIHFQKYMGHLLGVRMTWYPETIGDSIRMLVMTLLSRSHDSGEHGRELIESYPEAFAPRDGHTGLQRCANTTTTGSTACTRRCSWHRYPPEVPDALRLAVGADPAAAVSAHLRRRGGTPGPSDRPAPNASCAGTESWYRAQMAGREAAFDASGARSLTAPPPPRGPCRERGPT